MRRAAKIRLKGDVLMTKPTKTLAAVRSSRPAAPGTEANVERYAIQINENWQKSKEGIFRVAKDCAAAKKSLTVSEKQALYALLPFSQSMFSRLAGIGDDERLTEHESRLPPSISTMYILHNLKDDQLQAAVSEGVLERREDLVKWIRHKAGKSPSTKNDRPELPSQLFCIYAEIPLSPEQHVALERRVVQLAEEEGLKASICTGENLSSWLKSTFPRTRRKPEAA
jgi:hypothetical protein